jgi:hypothetical protein
MKKNLYICILIYMTLSFVACTDENQEARTPKAIVNVNATSLNINESMEIKFSGVGDQFVVYTGDESHNYALKDSSNSGFVVNKGLFTYSYSVPGTFHVVCLASTYDTYMGGGLSTDKTEFDVTVIDDVTTIDKVYSSITPNVYYAELVKNENWVMRIPTKQVYNGKDININASRQRLNVDINSDSTKIYIDNALFDTKAYYDLTTTHDIKAISNHGSTRNYKLYTMIYPEFASVGIAGFTGTLTRNAYYQDQLNYSFVVPSGTNISNVIVNFSVDDNVSFYANGVEIKSGSSIDLTKPNVVYTLKRLSSDDSNITATSNVNFTVSYN